MTTTTTTLQPIAVGTSTMVVNNFTFTTVDYFVFIIMLSMSTCIGIYFGFFSKAKNTTDEYLMGGKKMKTIPIAISLVASQLSAIAIMSVPAENYSYGFGYIFLVISMVLVVPILCYIIIPVFYENNISNCYEYLELRFNKRTRQLVTASFILNAFLVLPVYIFVPSLAFSQVTGLNIHLINTAVSSICVFYTMLGGIKAVVWTDVVQAGIMFSSVALVAILGILKIGGLSKVLEYAEAGGRLDFSFSWDPRLRVTAWNGLIGGLIMWTGHVGLNQSCVQRIVSLPSLQHAKKALALAGVGFILLMSFNSFIGIIMFARYYGCDPLLTGLVDKADKLVPFFVQDVMGHLKGMPGIFISCVFSAALSTMSAILNSLAGVVYFDYIKPFIRHTDARANAIMKIFVVVMGFYCVAGGLIVQRLNSIIQVVMTITGINTGAVVGIFLLGMFVPRVNGKVAMTSMGFSVLAMIWFISYVQMKRKPYVSIPTSLDRCEIIENFGTILNRINATTAATSSITTALPSITATLKSHDDEDDFSIFDISFYWYKLVGATLVWLLAIPLSYIWNDNNGNEDEKINPKLYSPFVRKFLKIQQQEQLRIIELEPLNSPTTKMTTIDSNTTTTIIITEKQNDH